MKIAQKSATLGTGLLIAAICSALWLTTAAPRARADDNREKCRHRIERAEAKLDKAIHQHGEQSSQAQSRRHELNEEREHCWSAYHVWWNGMERKWHSERDWDHDDRDHEHDHDHH